MTLENLHKRGMVESERETYAELVALLLKNRIALPRLSQESPSHFDILPIVVIFSSWGRFRPVAFICSSQILRGCFR